jgi:hypothetical protein
VAFDRDVRGRLPIRFVREPLTTSHCAVHASKGAFFIADVKNWAGTCSDHQPRTIIPHCSKCAFYVKSAEHDRRAEASALVAAIGSSDQSAVSILDRRAGQIDKGVGPAKAHDLSLAYNTRGRLQWPLKYLPSCVVPCPRCAEQGPALDCPICQGEGEQIAQPEIFNRFLGCQVFQPARPAPAAGGGLPPLRAATAAVVEPVPAETSAPGAAATVLSRLGFSPFGQWPPSSRPAGVVEDIVSGAIESIFDRLRSANAAATSTVPPADQMEIPAPHLQVLAPGEPPLTNEMLRRSVAVVTAAHQGTMTDAAQRDYSALVTELWNRRRLDGINLQLGLIRLYAADRTTAAWHAEAAGRFNEFAAWTRAQGTGPGTSNPSSSA